MVRRVVREDGSDRLAVREVGALEEVLFGEKGVGARPGCVHEANVAVHVVAHVAQTRDVVDGGRREVDVVGRDHPDRLVVVLRLFHLNFNNTTPIDSPIFKKNIQAYLDSEEANVTEKV